ncbi:helix-turn-helix domain-containing protein [Paenibacillus humicola]|uniref:helix-turn-helix domain-containing protein n=1 Tax=Paenibacillus humicola TaxID=3110540 RepID=UPI00237AA14B|nr:AraC family transcriptional regulator [Paenibacillus humicola]
MKEAAGTMFEDTFDRHPVQRADYHLSADKPVVAFNDVYLDSRSALFDMHYDVEIGIVRSGKMVRKYPDFEAELGPGEVWLCGVWEPHGFRLSSVPCEVYSLVISPEFLVGAEQAGFAGFGPFAMAADKRPRMPTEYYADMLRICDRLRPVIDDEGMDALRWKKLWVLEILTYLTQGSPASAAGRKSAEAGTYAGIRPSLQLVLRSKTLVPASEAARACMMSTSRFTRHFRELMGISFAKFALRHRVKEAARQLAATDDSIKAVAAEWGFTDTSHFHNCFVSHFSVTPKKYRELHRSRQSGEEFE